MATVVPENWRFGELTEDKKLPVRFLDADGLPILLSNLYAYGVEVFTKSTTIVKCGYNMDALGKTQNPKPVSGVRRVSQIQK
mgnify:CR=1 FL=1